MARVGGRRERRAQRDPQARVRVAVARPRQRLEGPARRQRVEPRPQRLGRDRVPAARPEACERRPRRTHVPVGHRRQVTSGQVGEGGGFAVCHDTRHDRKAGQHGAPYGGLGRWWVGPAQGRGHGPSRTVDRDDLSRERTKPVRGDVGGQLEVGRHDAVGSGEGGQRHLGKHGQRVCGQGRVPRRPAASRHCAGRRRARRRSRTAPPPPASAGPSSPPRAPRPGPAQSSPPSPRRPTSRRAPEADRRRPPATRHRSRRRRPAAVLRPPRSRSARPAASAGRRGRRRVSASPVAARGPTAEDRAGHRVHPRVLDRRAAQPRREDPGRVAQRRRDRGLDPPEPRRRPPRAGRHRPRGPRPPRRPPPPPAAGRRPARARHPRSAQRRPRGRLGVPHTEACPDARHRAGTAPSVVHSPQAVNQTAVSVGTDPLVISSDAAST